MSSPSSNKVFTIRASAVLTTGEVNGTSFGLNKAHGSRCSVDLRFTIGSLTNVTVRYYVTDADALVWVPLETAGGGVVSHVLSADTKKSVLIDAPGWSYLRVSAQGSGTVTDSLLEVKARYITRAI